MADDHTSSHENDKADDKADAALGDLRNGLTVGENQDGDREQELDCLENVDAVSCPSAINSEEAVCITLHGVSIRIHCHENFPELESGAVEVRDGFIEDETITYYIAKPPKTVYKATPGP